MAKRDELVREAVLIETGVDIGPGSILKRRREAVDAALARHEAERHDDGAPVAACPACPPPSGGCM